MLLKNKPLILFLLLLIAKEALQRLSALFDLPVADRRNATRNTWTGLPGARNRIRSGSYWNRNHEWMTMDTK